MTKRQFILMKMKEWKYGYDVADLHDWEEEYKEEYGCQNCYEVKPLYDVLDQYYCHDCAFGEDNSATAALKEVEAKNATSTLTY